MPGQLLFMRHERNVVPGIFGDTGKLMAYPGNVSKLREGLGIDSDSVVRRMEEYFLNEKE